MDLSKTYRSIVREYFPHARIVADRFHVIRLVIRAFKKTWMAVDEKGITAAGVRRLLKSHPQNLLPEEWTKLSGYLRSHEVIRILYEEKNELFRLFKIKHRRVRQCRALIPPPAGGDPKAPRVQVRGPRDARQHARGLAGGVALRPQ